MTLKTLRNFVSDHPGQSLPTIGGKSTFKIHEKGSAFVFELESGKTRNESFDWVEKSLDVFNQTGSYLTTKYPDTQNASYVLGLFAAAEKAPVVKSLVADIEAIQLDDNLLPTTKSALILARIGQGTFREAILSAWNSQCAVTGSTTLSAIRASHIKPWCVSSDAERLDPKNGLPLIANLDALFDIGLISFNRDGSLIVSSTMLESEVTLFNLAGKSLRRVPCKDTGAYLIFTVQPFS